MEVYDPRTGTLSPIRFPVILQGEAIPGPGSEPSAKNAPRPWTAVETQISRLVPALADQQFQVADHELSEPGVEFSQPFQIHDHDAGVHVKIIQRIALRTDRE